MVWGLPRWAYWAIGIVVAVVAFLALINVYGNAREREGRAKADAEWKAASDRLVQKAAAAGTKADRQAAGRAADYAARVEDEKEAIERVNKEGGSSFDVLFGNRG